MALYQYQQVLGSKCTVQFLGNGASLNATTAEGVIYPTTTATGVTALNDAIDKRSSKFCSITYYQGPFKNKSNMLVHKIAPHKHLGLTKQQYRDDEDCRSAVGSLPARILYWAIGTQINDVSTTMNLNARIVIDYTIQFSGLVPLDTVDSSND